MSCLAKELSFMTSDPIQLEDSWKQKLLSEFQKPYMQNLKAFLQQELKARKVIYPRGPDIFNAFKVLAEA